MFSRSIDLTTQNITYLDTVSSSFANSASFNESRSILSRNAIRRAEHCFDSSLHLVCHGMSAKCFQSTGRHTDLANLYIWCVLVDYLKCYRLLSCSIQVVGAWSKTNLVRPSDPTPATQRCHIETEKESLDSSSTQP